MNTTEQNAAKNTEAQVRRVLDVMNQGKLKQAIRITATPSQQPLPKTASKFGGVPYLPVGESAPTNASGQPLGMIAQINCAQLPQNNIYPKSGMLQFWIDPHDTVWGYDYNKPAVQENWRVLYYESVDEPSPDAPLPVIDWDTIGLAYRTGKRGICALVQRSRAGSYRYCALLLSRFCASMG